MAPDVPAVLRTEVRAPGQSPAAARQEGAATGDRSRADASRFRGALRHGTPKTFLTLLILLRCFVTPPLGAEANPPISGSATNPLDYTLIVTGEELLRGAYADGHTAFITRALHLLGGHCVGSMTVDDKAEDLKQALRFARGRARLILVTGGLGPTVNDITRDALAQFTGIPLREHPDVLAEMERRFNQSRDQLRANLRRQTQVPTRGTYLKNPQGTAVGLVFELAESVIVALPGPPRELQPMVQNELVPFLRRQFGLRPVGCSLMLRFVGVGQSLIDQTLREHAPLPPDVLVGSSFEGGRVDFTFALPGDSAADRARLKQIEATLREHLGDYFYADDGVSLEEWVAQKLKVRGGSLVLVEVGSRGRLATSLAGVKGLEDLLAGAYVAPTEERMRAILEVPETVWAGWKPGAERIQGLALAAARSTGSPWVIAVGQVTGSGGSGPQVWVAFGSPPQSWETPRMAVQGSSEPALASLTTQIWDRLRRQLR